MKLPKTIKIANHVFNVAEWNSNEASAHGRFGECDCNTLSIRISTAHPDSHIRETLMHEILHAIFWSYGVKDIDDEERTITGLAVGLSQVWQDNPKLYKQIFGDQHD